MNFKKDKIIYSIEKHLKPDHENISRELYNEYKINICMYHINNLLELPFLEYILYKQPDNVVTFPYLYHDFKKDRKNAFSKIDKSVDTIMKNFPDSKKNFKGYLELNSELYLFYEITEIQNKSYEKSFYHITEKETYMFCLIDEILNQRAVLCYGVADYVTKLFLTNTWLVHLNRNNRDIEIPYVLYHGNNSSKINYMSVFDLDKQSNNSMFGPFYYFSLYITAVRYAAWGVYNSNVDSTTDIYSNKHGKHVNGSIMRFVIFLGNTKIKLDKETDPLDKSSITITMLNDDLTSEKYKNYLEKNQRISDRDGVWKKNYTSVYVGIIKDKTNFPMLCVDDYKRYKLLSISDIDLTDIPEKNDISFDYNTVKLL